jgi:hypothetical protein
VKSVLLLYNQREDGVCCGIIIVEILTDAKNEKDFPSLNDSLRSFSQIPIDHPVVQKASQWGFLLNKKGKFLSTTDCPTPGVHSNFSNK